MLRSSVNYQVTLNYFRNQSYYIVMTKYAMIKNILLTALLLFAADCYAQEICNNAMDDDGDGLVDINDPDCLCNQSDVSSLIINPSFEQYEICPTNFGMMEVCSGWDQITAASLDYLNTCGYVPSSAETAGLVPFPNGSGCVSGYIHTIYKEYIGNCLNSPLHAGTTYQITFNIASIPVASGTLSPCLLSDYKYDPIDITIYGSPNCTGTYVNTYLQPTEADNSWINLGSAYYTPSGNWGELTITFTPSVDINTFMIGSPEDLPPSYIVDNSIADFCAPYFFYDNLILNEASIFGTTIVAAGNYCTGEMVLTANMGVPLEASVSYQWYKEGIAIIGATNATYDILSEAAGNYTVKVTNGSNCYISSTYTVSDVTPGPDYSLTEPTCYVNGSITITTSADLYSFDNGVTWNTSATMANLPPGKYFVKVKYNSGCVSAPSIVTLVVPDYLPEPLYVVQDATCGPTGSIMITTPASQYSFDGGVTWDTIPVLQDISGGDYQVRIKNAAGCASFVAEVHVGQNFLPEPSTTFINPQCADDGSIAIVTPADEYSFDGGLTWQTNPVLNNLAPGSYHIVIKDSGDCISEPKLVNLQRVLAAAAAVTQNAGCGTNGSITISNSIAVEFSIDGGATWQSNPLFADLPAGQYAIAFKYPQGCVSYLNTVTVYETLLNYSPQASTVAAGCETGSITITTLATEYSFDGGLTWQDSPTLSGLEAGSYTIVIKDQNGCRSQNKTVTVPSTPGALSDPLYTVSPSFCNNNGSISITTPASEYSFDNGQTWSSSTTVSSLAPGTYIIKIKSATGCESPGLSVTVAQGTVPLPETSAVKYCKDAVAPGLSATGENLVWYNVQSGGVGTNSAPFPSTASVGEITYYVSQTINGCESGRAALKVTIADIPGPPITEDDIVYCQGSITETLTASGTNLLWYTDINGIGLTESPKPSSAQPGVFFYYVSQSVNGCESTRIPVTVIIKPTPGLPQTDEEISYELGQPAGVLEAIGQDLTWYDSGHNILAQAPIPSTAEIGTVFYYVSQTINGCEGPLIEIKVTVAPNYVVIDWPKYFTPNGDAFHPTWNIYNPGKGIKLITYIFDRYGKLLTAVKSPGEGWDGNFNGHALPAGDYWFKTVYEEFGVQKEVSSHFSLMR